MKRLPVLLIVPALLALSLAYRLAADGPSTATCCTVEEEDGPARSCCRHTAHSAPTGDPTEATGDSERIEARPTTSPPIGPEELSMPTQDPQPATKREQSVRTSEVVPTLPRMPASQLMVGPDGVIYQRTSTPAP